MLLQARSTDYQRTGQPQPQDVQLEPLAGPDMTTSYLDTTLQTEGLNWCSDLTIADPTGLLPLALLATMCSTVLYQPIAGGANKPAKITFMQKVGLSFGFLFFLVSQQMPAGILLYFIPSLAAGWLQSQYVSWKHPISPAIQPCARPVRMKIRSDAEDL